MFQALVSVLGAHGVTDPNEVRLKQQEYLADLARALSIYRAFSLYLEEMNK